MLTEETVLSQVNYLPLTDTVDVQWTHVIKKDGAVLAEKYIRRAYARDEKAAFIADVDNGAALAAAYGWQ